MPLKQRTCRSSALPLLLFVLIFFQLPSSIRSQSCAPLTDPTCSAFIAVGTPVFVPEGSTLAFQELIVNRYVNVLNYAGFPEPCRSYSIQVFCASWLRPCFVIDNQTVPVPQEPCVETCQHYSVACFPFNPPNERNLFGLGIYFPPGYSTPINCTAPVLDSAAGNVSYWANASNPLQVGNTSYEVPCGQPVAVVPPASIYCEPPLVVVHGAQGPSCAFTCPVPSLSDSQYDNAKTMQGVMGWLSWAGSSLLIIALVIPPQSREFPRNLIIMTAIAANIAAGAIILPTYAGYDETWCGGSDVTLTPETVVTGVDAQGLPDLSFGIDVNSDLAVQSSLCTFQGAMLQFGFLAAVCWWFIIAFNMSVELYFGQMLNLDRPRWKWTRFGIYNVIGWGVPFLLMVIPASAGRIKFLPAATYCFVTGEDNNAWILTFWFIPVGICLVGGVCLFLLALLRITILMITIKKVKAMLLLYLRLFIFIFLYLTMFVFIFAYNINNANNSGSIDSGYQAYYKCLAFGEPDCSLDDSVSNYNLVMLKGWAISSLGLMLFLVFVSVDVLKFWFQILRGTFIILFIQRNPKDMIQIFRMVAYKSAQKSITNSTALTITADPDADDEDGASGGSVKDTEMDEVDAPVERNSSSSSSNEEEQASE